MEEDTPRPATASSSTASEGNPFVTIIDRNSDTGTKEKQQQNETAQMTNSTLGLSARSSIGFQPEFITPGPNSIRIPPDDFMNTLVGFNNMMLAHEISINRDYKLERFVPPQDR